MLFLEALFEKHGSAVERYKYRKNLREKSAKACPAVVSTHVRRISAMHSYRFMTFLSIWFLLAAIASAQPVAFPGSELERHLITGHDAGTSRENVAGTSSENVAETLPEHATVTIPYRAIEAGYFRPNNRWTPITNDILRSLQYHNTLFHKKFPIFFTGPDGFSKTQLEQAYTDFGSFHVMGRPEVGEHTLTVAKNQDGIPTVQLSTPEVHQHVLNAYSVRSVFGETAAAVAFGEEMPARSSVMRPRAGLLPWEAVWQADRAPENMALRDARRKLQKDGFIRFQASDGRSDLGVRLLNNGKKEIQWLVDSSPIFHV